MVALSLLGSLIINNLILKNLVARMRPYEIINGLIPLIRKPTDYSFPSGHTASSFAAVLESVISQKYWSGSGVQKNERKYQK